MVVSPSTSPIMSLYWVVGQDAFDEQLAMTHIPQQPVITNKLASLPEQLLFLDRATGNIHGFRKIWTEEIRSITTTRAGTVLRRASQSYD